jgi:hypothetical protein
MSLEGERCVRFVVNSRMDLGAGLGGAPHVHLGALLAADAEALLRVHAGKEAQWAAGQARALVEVCGSNPLALALAGGSIASRRCTPKVRCCSPWCCLLQADCVEFVPSGSGRYVLDGGQLPGNWPKNAWGNATCGHVPSASVTGRGVGFGGNGCALSWVRDAPWRGCTLSAGAVQRMRLWPLPWAQLGVSAIPRLGVAAVSATSACTVLQVRPHSPDSRQQGRLPTSKPCAAVAHPVLWMRIGALLSLPASQVPCPLML